MMSAWVIPRECISAARRGRVGRPCVTGGSWPNNNSYALEDLSEGVKLRPLLDLIEIGTQFFNIQIFVVDHLRVKRELPVLRERYGIETIGIFGSVSRGEDTPESDLDIIYSFRPEMDTYENLLDLGDFLENLFLRKVDLVSVEWMSERFRASVMTEAVFCTRERGTA